jgi:uncharacterized membrane protein YhaH (DUF805 family)
MTETLKNIALALAVTLVVFLVTAFVEWDMDVSQWLPRQRAALVGLCAICAAAAVMIRNIKHFS